MPDNVLLLAYHRYVTAIDSPPRAAQRGLDDIPGPAGGWLLGNATAFRRDLLGHLTRGMHEYGDVVGYELGPRHTPFRINIVAAHAPADVQQVLAQTERTFTKDTLAFRAMAEMMGSGLLTTEGDGWRRQRRMVQPLFTPKRVAGYANLMAEESSRAADEAPADGAEVDLHLLMMRYALRVVGRALFGNDIDDMVPVLGPLVPEVSSVTRRRIFSPLSLPLRYPTPGNRHARALRRAEYAVVDEILGRSPSPDEPGYDPERDDLVTRLRQARDPETGEPISADEIRDQALIFLLAGHETTAGALTFTLHLLGRHPDIQDEVAAEVRAVLGNEPAPTADHLQQLPLTRAALLEGMRLFPSAHATERTTAAEVEIGGYAVPPGRVVLVSPWTTHRHPRYWPDPLRFDPTRFMVTTDRPRYAYFPFGGGPRSCVGEHFALLEAVVLLATLLRRWRVISSRADLPVTPNITLRPVGEVPVRFARR